MNLGNIKILDLVLAAIIILIWGAWGLLDKKLVSLEPNVINVQILYFITDLSLLPAFALAGNITKSNFKFNWSVFGLAFITTVLVVIAGLLFLVLLKRNSTGWTAAITSVYPMVTVILGWMIFKEKIGITTIMGSLLICAGLVVINLPQGS